MNLAQLVGWSQIMWLVVGFGLAAVAIRLLPYIRRRH